jgi:hypothetical protein
VETDPNKRCLILLITLDIVSLSLPILVCEDVSKEAHSRGRAAEEDRGSQKACIVVRYGFSVSQLSL